MTLSPSPTPRTLLEVLRDRVRALEATPQDTDALLRAMDRPLGPQEDVRRRAQVLHLIIEDAALGGLRGSDGRRVDQTAVHAFVALGEPYASALSATGQRILASAPPPPLAPSAPWKEPDAPDAGASSMRLSARHVIGVIAVSWGVFELLYPHEPGGFFSKVGPLMALFSVIAPGLLLCLRSARQSRALYVLCSILEFWLVAGMVVLGSASFLLGGSGAANREIAHFATLMLFGVVARTSVLFSLLGALVASRRAR